MLGATGGVGRAVTERLAEAGAKLVLGARNEEDVEALADELGAVAHSLDARVFGEVDAMVDRAVEEHGGLAGVVNAVGSIRLKPAHITRAEELDEILDTNLKTAFAAVRSGARVLRDEGGSVVLFSTAAVRSGIPNHEAIAAAKGGVEGLTRAAATTCARAGVRLNAPAPGLTARRGRTGSSPATRPGRRRRRCTPSGAWASPATSRHRVGRPLAPGPGSVVGQRPGAGRRRGSGHLAPGARVFPPPYASRCHRSGVDDYNITT